MNNDLISRSVLLEEFEWLKENTGAYNHAAIDEIILRIKNVPAVDAVEVVRCKDCKHTTRSKVSPEKIICCLTKKCGTVDPDYFCADGERKMDAEV